MDATLIETHKREALYCYKRFKAYQPLNSWWAEQGLIVHSEFRDGNVPAGHEQLRVLEEAARRLPAGVRKLCLRSDTAAYQQDLLKDCAEGKNRRFGVIEFAIGADVTAAFRQAVATARGGLAGARPDRRCRAMALPDDELSEAGPLQAVRPRHPPHAGGRRPDPLAARALRQERGSARRDEGRSRRRAAAERAVRGQCGVVSDHGSRPQSQRDDEASGARRRLGGAAHEGFI